MTSELKLIYAYDPLCGWCYGLIPALRHFVAEEPNVKIEVLPGGLFVGTPSRPYSSLISHIRAAEVHLEAVTGQKPSEAFHEMIAGSEVVDASSERPSHAVLQMNKLAPDRALEFAHRVQEIHIADGKDLNLAQTYDDLCAAEKFPALDVDAILNATLTDPEIDTAYKKCAALRPQGYPTMFAVDAKGEVAGAIPSTYDPIAFVEEFRAIQHQHTN